MKRLITVMTLFATCSIAYAAEPAISYYTTSGIDPLTYIRQSNPSCPEWAIWTKDYTKLLTKAETCGVQIRLREAVCLLTGETLWILEEYQMEGCK